MAITQTGSTLQFNPGIAQTGTVSSSITVPADAEIVVVGLSGYASVGLPYGSMTFTKGSADTQMYKVSGGDVDTGIVQVGMFWLHAPDTGASKSLKWDWLRVPLTGSDLNVSVTFWKGIHTGFPVRDGQGFNQVGFPITTPTLYAQSGDLIVAFAGFFRSAGAAGSATIDSWSNLTELTEITEAGTNEGAWATGSPSGRTAVGAVTATNSTGGGVIALVLVPAAATITFDTNVAQLAQQSGRRASATADVVLSPPFFPANNTVLVVVGQGLVSYGESAPATITGGSLTWTQQKRENHSDGSWQCAVYIWTAPVTTGASMTVTVDFNNTTAAVDSGYSLNVFCVQNYSSVVQTFGDGANGTSRSGAYSGTLSSAPATTSVLISGVVTNVSSGGYSAVQAGSGWTQVTEVVEDFPIRQCQYRSGTTSTAVPLANLNSGFGWSIAAIEIATSAGGGGGASVTKRKSSMIGMGRMMGG